MGVARKRVLASRLLVGLDGEMAPPRKITYPKVCQDPDCTRTFVRTSETLGFWTIKKYCSFGGGTGCAFGNQERGLDLPDSKVCADPDCGRVFYRTIGRPSEWAARVLCGGANGSCIYGVQSRREKTKVCEDPDCQRPFRRPLGAARRLNIRRFCTPGGGGPWCKLGNIKRTAVHGETKICKGCHTEFSRGALAPYYWARRKYCGGLRGRCLENHEQRVSKAGSTKVCQDLDCGMTFAKRPSERLSKWIERKICGLPHGGRCSNRRGREPEMSSM